MSNKKYKRGYIHPKTGMIFSHYKNNGKEQWYSYSVSKTFEEGEQVVKWKYCEDIFKQLKPLTMEYAIKNHFSPIDCIKYFKPEWSDEQCDIYLWEFTSFPLSIESMINQLNKKFIK